MECELTVKQVDEKRKQLEAGIEKLVKEFFEGTKLDKGCLSIRWGMVSVSSGHSHPGVPSGYSSYMVTAMVNL
jgi:hypothetical protein